MQHDLWIEIRKVWFQLDEVIKYEAGDLNEDQTVALFQSLIDSGLAWSLPANYGKIASDLIALGVCQHAKGQPLTRLGQPVIQ